MIHDNVAQGALLTRLGTSAVNDRHCIVGIIATAFLADRTNGRAYDTTLCVLAKVQNFRLNSSYF